MAELEKVSFKKLDVDNYATWRTKMRFLLIQKGYWRAVETVGERDDAKALAAIGLCVEDHHLPTIEKCTTAKAAWEALEAIYQAKSVAKELQLTRELNSLKKNPHEDVTKYISRAKAIRDQLQAAGSTIQDRAVVIAVLAGLPSEYDMLVCVLENATTPPTLDELLPKALMIEQRSSPLEESKEQALFTKGKRSFKKAHSDRPSGSKERESRSCYYCGKTGHLKKDCFKKKAEEAKTSSGKASIALTATGSKIAGPTDWILDSGASRHITYNSSILVNQREAIGARTIVYGNGMEVQPRAEGEVLVLEECDTGALLYLEKVLYEPGASANLLSVKCATEAGAKFEFERGRCRIFKDGELLATATTCDGTYIIKGAVDTAASALVMKAKETPQLWHQRYGHLGYDNMARLPAMVKGIGVTAAEFKAANNEVCEPCLKAKQTRLPFKQSETNIERALDLLHMDVCGPMSVPTLGGRRYVVTFLDDFTGLSLVRVMKEKSEVPSMMMEVINLLENQSELKVKAIRSDNGGEFINHKVQDLAKRSVSIAH
jgi:gag-polypeptide of LTR copia-type/Integrase core domain/GAG-pre-integrase domain/Zinc knuckle